MRRAGERALQHFGRFTSVAATAENTTLSDRSVDFVTAGQAFHWFDAGKARREFARVLKPGGSVVLIWNSRRKDGKPFLVAYENLLRVYGTDYREVRHGRRGARRTSSVSSGRTRSRRRPFGTGKASTL